MDKKMGLVMGFIFGQIATMAWCNDITDGRSMRNGSAIMRVLLLGSIPGGILGIVGYLLSGKDKE